MCLFSKTRSFSALYSVPAVMFIYSIHFHSPKCNCPVQTREHEILQEGVTKGMQHGPCVLGQPPCDTGRSAGQHRGAKVPSQMLPSPEHAASSILPGTEGQGGSLRPPHSFQQLLSGPHSRQEYSQGHERRAWWELVSLRPSLPVVSETDSLFSLTPRSFKCTEELHSETQAI